MASYFLGSAYSVPLLYFYLDLPFPLLLLLLSCSVCVYSYLFLLRVDLCFRKGLWFVKFHGCKGPCCPSTSALLNHGPIASAFTCGLPKPSQLDCSSPIGHGAFQPVPYGDLGLVCLCAHQEPSWLPVLSSAQMWIPCSSWSCQGVVHWGDSWGDLAM